MSYWETHGYEADPGPWCERPSAQPGAIVLEFSNTFSDLTFLAASCRILYDGLRRVHARKKVSQNSTLYDANPSIILFNAAANLFHWMGTTFCHSCRCHIGHVLDVFGMCLVLGVLLVISLMRYMDNNGISFNPWVVFVAIYVPLQYGLWPHCQMYYHDELYEEYEFLLVFVLIFSLVLVLLATVFQPDPTVLVYTTAVVSIIAITKGLSLLYVIVGTLSILLLTTTLPQGKKRYSLSLDSKLVLIILPLAASGLIMQKLDMNKIICFEDSVFQGHAYWHSSMGSCIFLMHKLFLGESNATRKIIKTS